MKILAIHLLTTSMYGQYKEDKINKELTKLITQATRQGWSVTLTNGGHYKWQAPNGKVFFSAKTPSDTRALKNIQRDLKSNGFILVKKERKRDERTN